MCTRILSLFFILYAVSAHAQEKGNYVTLDQGKQIHFMEGHHITLSEGWAKEIRGTYTRKIGRLIVYPTSIMESGKSLSSDALPKEMVYQMKNVTGQKFQLRELREGSEWEAYFLRTRVTFGIE